MILVTAHPQDQSVAQRLITDLNASGIAAAAWSGNLNRDDVLLPIISPAAAADKEGVVAQAINQALDRGLHIVPVTTAGASIPKQLDHLSYVVFDDEVDLEGVRALIAQVTSPEAKLPLKVLTPKARQANRRAGWIIGAAAIFMFLVGIYGIGVLGIQRPNEEYEAIDRQVEQTIAAEIAPPLATMRAYLPQNPEQGWVYPATLFAAPTRYRPFIAGTATAYAVESGIYAATPTPPAQGN